jgi:hypothetical protein
MTKTELHRLVDELPDEAVEGTSLFIQRVLLRQLDPSQSWVWTDEWQAKLSASLADLRAGRAQPYESAEAFLQAL